MSLLTYPRHKQNAQDARDEQQDERPKEAVESVGIIVHENPNHRQHDADDEDSKDRDHDHFGVPELLDSDVERLGGKQQAGKEVHALIGQEDREPVAGGLGETVPNDQGHFATLQMRGKKCLEIQ